jgi:tripartite-type tricarboxylate transporter receptor subunit TctC
MDRHFSFCFLLVLAALVGASTVQAQELPNRPIRFVVGFAGGGSTDAMARIIAERLSQRIGRSVVVENNAGASGRLAAEQVKKSEPDGTTVLVGNIGMVVLAPVTFRQLSYDPLRDFEPVIRAADFQLAMAAAAHTNARDTASLISWLKQNGDKANVGVPLQASLSHLTALRFLEAAKVQATVVVYRGSALATQDMLGGRLAGSAAAVGDFIEQHRAGTMRIIGVSGTSRAPSLPDVPTFAEAGLKGLEGNGWNGFLLPAGTPKAIVDLYSREIAAVVAQPDVVRRLDQLGFVPSAPNSPAEFGATIRSEMESWRPVVRAAGLEQ